MALADKVSDAWIAFARTRRSEHTQAAALAGVQCQAERPTMVINNQSKVVSDPIREQRLAMFHALDLADLVPTWADPGPQPTPRRR